MPTPPNLIEPVAPRMLPRLTDANREFWTGGKSGRLLVPRCDSCRRWVLPPQEACRECGGGLAYEAVSGDATVFTYTTNAHQYHPDVPPPNLIAIVELVEQADLRLATNLVGCDESEVTAGMAVSVAFERHGEVYYPVFQPGDPAR